MNKNALFWMSVASSAFVADYLRNATWLLESPLDLLHPVIRCHPNTNSKCNACLARGKNQMAYTNKTWQLISWSLIRQEFEPSNLDLITHQPFDEQASQIWLGGGAKKSGVTYWGNNVIQMTKSMSYCY